MNLRRASALGAVLLASMLCQQQASPFIAAEVAARHQWSATWISHPTAPLREPVTLHFRRTFTAPQAHQHFIVHVSADNRFVLFLNAVRIGDGPARGDLDHWRYESFDIGPMLKDGENTLSATVWNFGIYAPLAQITDRVAFMLEGDTANEAMVNTGANWLVEEERGHRALPRKPDGFWAYMAIGPGEILDATSYDWDWQSSKPGVNWVPAATAMRESISPTAGKASSRGIDGDAPWGLVPDQLPPMSYTPEDAGHIVRSNLAGATGFPKHPVSVPAHTRAHLMFDRSELTTAYPRLAFSGGKGSHITVTYAEALYDEQQHKGNRNDVGTRQAIGVKDEILPDGGQHRSFEPLWWRTWRYLDLDVQTADDALNLDDLQAHFTAFPFRKTAQFSASDADLKRIWDIGWHSVQLDSHETYMDTPYYEQLQYVGDTRIEALISYAVTSDDRLGRQAITAFDQSRIPEGITASRYPSSQPQYIPPFSLLWVGMLHDYYWYRSDTAFVRNTLPGTRSVLDWFATYQQTNGLLKRTPWWTFVDWVETKQEFPSYDASGNTCLVTLQYVGALQQAVEMETALGSKSVAEKDQDRLAKAKAGIYTNCWDRGRRLIADSPAKDTFSEHANSLAVLYDVIPPAEQADVMKRALGKDLGLPLQQSGKLIAASYYFRFYVARALDHAGLAHHYFDFLHTWRELLALGFTTWPEAPGDTRSDSHAWTAHPTYDLLTLVAGIAPSSPAFKTVHIEPHLGALTSLEVVYPHEQGLIHVRYAIDGGKLSATIVLPAGLPGTFVWQGKQTDLHGGENKLIF